MTPAVSQRTILAYPFHDWRKAQREGCRTRDGHLIEAFAARPDVRRVLVVNRPTSLAERRLRRLDARVAGRPEGTWGSRAGRAFLTTVAPGIVALDIAVPDVIRPLARRRAWWFDVFERPVVARLVAEAVEQVGPPTDVVAWVPTVAPVMFCPGARVVYDSLDNWLIHPELRAHRERAARAYEQIVPRADRVVVSGPASARVLSAWRGEIDVVPNGVDPERFAGAFERPSDLPPGPIVGYAGKLADRIDEELVMAVAGRLPRVTFAFVGPVLSARSVRRMRRLPNVLLLGDRAYDRLPAYLGAMDVAWIPHRVGRGETGGDPIKLYEYLAAGREVVSTRIDGWPAWSRLAHLVDGADTAADVIAGLLAGRRPRLGAAVPPGRTWAEIANALLASAGVRSEWEEACA